MLSDIEAIENKSLSKHKNIKYTEEGIDFDNDGFYNNFLFHLNEKTIEIKGYSSQKNVIPKEEKNYLNFSIRRITVLRI